jgi:PAS domain S-box-containing protein
MRDVMNAAPCGFAAFSDDGTIVESNQTLADMLGYKRVELVGWHIDKILPPGGRIFYHTYLFPLLKVKSEVEEIYVALRAKDGTDIPVLLNAVRREIDGVFVSECVCLRMLRRHAYEDQLLQARRLAEESNAAKAKFLSMMSHDLRTPLTTIYGNAQLLMEAVTDAQLAEAVGDIRQACELQMMMIGDILEFARLDSGRVQVSPRAIAIGDTVSRAEALVRVQAEEAGIQLTSSGCGDGIAAMADPNRLQQILLNLLTNAIKFTPPGGMIEIGCSSDGERTRILVRDNGIGIEADQLQRIFSPFVQLDAGPVSSSITARGVGLGLAISRDLARAMGGDVTAESTAGTGSAFTIDLPAAAAVDAKKDDAVSV